MTAFQLLSTIEREMEKSGNLASVLTSAGRRGADVMRKIYKGLQRIPGYAYLPAGTPEWARAATGAGILGTGGFFFGKGLERTAESAAKDPAQRTLNDRLNVAINPLTLFRETATLGGKWENPMFDHISGVAAARKRMADRAKAAPTPAAPQAQTVGNVPPDFMQRIAHTYNLQHSQRPDYVQMRNQS